MRQQEGVTSAGTGDPMRSQSYAGKCAPPRAFGHRNPRVNVLQIHHCDSQAYPLVLSETVLTSELQFFFKCVVLFLTFRLDPRCHDGTCGRGEWRPSCTAAHVPPMVLSFCQYGPTSPTFQQMSQGALTLTHLNPSSKPVVNTQSPKARVAVLTESFPALFRQLPVPQRWVQVSHLPSQSLSFIVHRAIWPETIVTNRSGQNVLFRALTLLQLLV